MRVGVGRAEIRKGTGPVRTMVAGAPEETGLEGETLCSGLEELGLRHLDASGRSTKWVVVPGPGLWQGGAHPGRTARASLNVPVLLHRADGRLDEAATLFLAGNLRSVEPGPSGDLGPPG